MWFRKMHGGNWEPLTKVRIYEVEEKQVASDNKKRLKVAIPTNISRDVYACLC